MHRPAGASPPHEINVRAARAVAYSRCTDGKPARLFASANPPHRTKISEGVSPMRQFRQCQPAMSRSLVLGCATILTVGGAGLATARAAEPIKIGVIGEESSVAGASLTKAAQMAADDINAKGGVDGRKIELTIYDDHSSAADAVRAFQRAAKQDKVSAILATYISEVALAIEPGAE